MNKEAIERLVDVIEDLTTEEEITIFIKGASIAIGCDYDELRLATNNRYYEKYVRSNRDELLVFNQL